VDHFEVFQRRFAPGDYGLVGNNDCKVPQSVDSPDCFRGTFQEHKIFGPGNKTVELIDGSVTVEKHGSLFNRKIFAVYDAFFNDSFITSPR
jgi:hypothetical protein